MIIMGEERAPVAKEKKTKIRAKKERTGRKHESLKVWEYYEVKEGGLVRKRKHCPRCGPGTSLSEHKDRTYCGRCGYTQFQKGGVREGTEQPTETAEEKKDEQPAETVKEEAPAEEQPAEEKPAETEDVKEEPAPEAEEQPAEDEKKPEETEKEKEA